MWHGGVRNKLTLFREIYKRQRDVEGRQKLIEKCSRFAGPRRAALYFPFNMDTKANGQDHIIHIPIRYQGHENTSHSHINKNRHNVTLLHWELGKTILWTLPFEWESGRFAELKELHYPFSFLSFSFLRVISVIFFPTVKGKD